MLAAIVGARPNFIKHAALAPYLPDDTFLVHTGQHYDYEMSRIFFDQLEMPTPGVNLGIREKTHSAQLGKMLLGLEKVLVQYDVDTVIVYGDTNSSLAGALCANKLALKLVHIEAGVRHFNRSVPEEVNRVLIDHISNLLMCPTELAMENARRESCFGEAVLTGDLHYDLFLKVADRLKQQLPPLIADLIGNEPYFLVTIHRASNTDDLRNLEAIVKALLTLKQQIVFPIHPRTKRALELAGLYEIVENATHIHLIDPLGYVDFMRTLIHSERVLTDSGGVQKEAYFCKVPCITLRNYSPWPETQINQWNQVIVPDVQSILTAVEKYPQGEQVPGLFGKGTAGVTISAAIHQLRSTSR